jgi:protein SCO1/2
MIRSKATLAVITCSLVAVWILLSNDANAEQDSIYSLTVPLTAPSQAQSFGLDINRGHYTLTSMFYASCPHVCPMLIGTLQMIERELSPMQQQKLRVLLISVDPERDDVAALKELQKRHGLAGKSNWILARPEPDDVRLIAAVLGVKYRKMNDGEINHTTAITLIDPDGHVVANSAVLGNVDDEFVELLKQSLDTLPAINHQ